MSGHRKLKELLEIAEILRIDGSLDAPYIFLTIEDGGNHNEGKTLQEIISRFTPKEYRGLRLDIWEPTESTEARKDGIGMIGLGIIKFWESLAQEDIDTKTIYQKSCPIANLKSLPLAKTSVKAWDKELKPAFGLEHWEYELLAYSRAKISQKKLLFEMIKEKRERKFVIAGSFQHWFPLIVEAFHENEIFYSHFEGSDKHRVYFDQKNHPIFASTNCIRTKLSDDAIQIFKEKKFI